MILYTIYSTRWDNYNIFCPSTSWSSYLHTSARWPYCTVLLFNILPVFSTVIYAPTVSPAALPTRYHPSLTWVVLSLQYLCWLGCLTCPKRVMWTSMGSRVLVSWSIFFFMLYSPRYTPLGAATSRSWSIFLISLPTLTRKQYCYSVNMICRNQPLLQKHMLKH